MPVSRREFIKTVGAFSTLYAFTGCCTFRKVTRLNLGKDTVVVDPHCHIFNGRDLDIYNYIVNSPMFKKLGLVEGPILDGLVALVTKIAPPLDDDLAFVNGHIDARKRWMASPSRPSLDEDAEDQYDVELRRDIAQLRSNVRSLRSDGISREKAKLVLEPSLAKFNREKAKFERSVEKINSQAELEAHYDAVLGFFAAPAYLDFIEGMWNSRVVNMYSLFENHPEVSLFTPAMMNIDSWFQFLPHQPHIPTTPIDDQVELYAKISILSRGKMLSFVAFDPRQELEWKPGNDPRARVRPTELLKSCRDLGCFVGVKLYPPQTAAPANNYLRDCFPSPDGPPAFWPPGFGANLDKVMDDLFKQCVACDFSVMAHTDRSCNHWNDFLDNGSPRNWKAALLNGNQRLRVNLAHYGGITDPDHWREGDSSTGVIGINELLQDDALPGVYTDIADFSEIESAPELADAFLSKLETEVTEYPVVAKRVMYGSDYYMDGITKCYELYCHDWIAKFKDKFPLTWKDYMGNNALAFLALQDGNQGQGKLVRGFLDVNKLHPKWRKDLTLIAPAS